MACLAVIIDNVEDTNESFRVPQCVRRLRLRFLFNCSLLDCPENFYPHPRPIPLSNTNAMLLKQDLGRCRV
jgi:hypothetical protein